MAFDVKAWLADPAFAFSTEEQASLLTSFSADTRLAVLGGNQLRQSDYSKAMDAGKAEIATERAKLVDADTKLNAELAEWATVQGASAEKVAAANKRVAALEQQVLTSRQRIEQVAHTAGLDAAVYLKDLDAPVTPPPAGTPPAGDPPAGDSPNMDGYAKTDDIRQVNQLLHLQPFALQTISNEHLALTGEPLDAMALHAEITRRAAAKEDTSSLRAVWESFHDIPAKRAAAATAKYDADITAAEERGRVAATSEAAIPGGSPAGARAIVFQAPPNADGTPGAPRTSALERPQPQTRISSAVTALASGRYRQPGQPGSSPPGAPAP